MMPRAGFPLVSSGVEATRVEYGIRWSASLMEIRGQMCW